MKLVLDTCVLSEFTRARPEPKVVEWLRDQNEADLFITSVTIGEIEKGLELQDDLAKREKLEFSLRAIMGRFQSRILIFDAAAARRWGRLQAQAKRAGILLPLTDALITAIAMENDCGVATRNANDFARSGVTVVNPWD